MAIAQDALVNGGESSSGVSSYTYSHTCTGSNLCLIVAVYDRSGDTTTGVTYNGVAMSQLKKATVPTQGFEVYLYGLINPATGAHNVVISRSGSTSTITGLSVSYTGVKQSGLPDASASGTATTQTITTSLTTVAGNTVALTATATPNGGGITASTGATELNHSGAFMLARSTTFPIVSPGSYSMTIDGGSGSNQDAQVMISLAPPTTAYTLTCTVGAFILSGIASVLVHARSLLTSVANFLINTLLIDFFTEVGATSPYSVYSAQPYRGQSFTNTNSILLRNCQFYLEKQGSPTGNAVAQIYTHSGTYGTSSIPTGSPLATSNTFNVATLPTSPQLITFTFSGANKINLLAATYYCVVLNYSGGNGSNVVSVFINGSGGSSGNSSISSDGTNWTAIGNSTAFYVYGDTPVATITSARGITTTVSSFILTGIAASFAKAWAALTTTVTRFVITGINIIFEPIGGLVWKNQTKNSASITNQTKNASTWTNQGKN